MWGLCAGADAVVTSNIGFRIKIGTAGFEPQSTIFSHALVTTKSWHGVPRRPRDERHPTFSHSPAASLWMQVPAASFRLPPAHPLAWPQRRPLRVHRFRGTGTPI